MKNYIIYTYLYDNDNPQVFYQTVGNTPLEAAEAWAAWLLEDRIEIDKIKPSLKMVMSQFHIKRIMLSEITNEISALFCSGRFDLNTKTWEVEEIKMKVRHTDEYK